MITFPDKLELANTPTPLTLLQRYSQRFDGVRVWMKRDELTGMEVSGNKIRKLEYSLAEALRQGCDTVITCGGIQSNHCRATAILAVRLGMKCHLILRGDKPDAEEGNLLLDYLAGAKVTYLHQREWAGHQQLASEIAEEYARQDRKAFFIPIGASDEIGLWGYIDAARELGEDLERLAIAPQYIVCATGSGGTQGGLILGNSLFELGSRVVAVNVSDDAAYFENKIREDYRNWKSRYDIDLDTDSLVINTLEGYLGPGYGRADQPVFDTIAELAACEGLFLDPVYTGKAFHGMVQELSKGEEGAFPAATDVVFIHTGGIFGVFPQGQNFNFAS